MIANIHHLTQHQYSTFNIETLLKVQTFDFKHNISVNFKAWICATHPEYIRTSLSNKIAPNDLNKFKDKYEYEKRKRDPTAPWHNFVQTLPKLIRETTEHAQQLDKEPLTLQQKYDALLKEHLTLSKRIVSLNAKFSRLLHNFKILPLSITLLRETGTLTERIVERKLTTSRKRHVTTRRYSRHKQELEDTILQTRTELNHTRNSLYHYVAKTRTYENKSRTSSTRKTRSYNRSLISNHTIYPQKFP